MKCGLCNSGNVERVMDLGSHALAGAFLKPESFASERRYPLALTYCADCFGVQVEQPVDPAILFSDYFYFTSAIGTMREHFARLAGEIVARFRPKFVVEIGCNDGALLSPLGEGGVSVIGVDPSSVSRSVSARSGDVIGRRRLPILQEFFTAATAKRLRHADVIAACNVFAHMDNVPAATEAVRDLLTEDGVFIIEVNRLDALVADLQYDWIYHEHRYYYSLLALSGLLERHGLEVFEVKRIATHAGSMRVYAGHRGRRPVHSSVARQLEHEIWMGLDHPERLLRFAVDAAAHRDSLRETVKGWKGDAAGYGACGRANTMLQYAGLDRGDIPYIVDDAPAKHGYYTPGSHIPVVPALRGNSAHLLVFAWSFLAEIERRIPDYAGEVVIPLPHIRAQQRRVAA